jgi:hypothetical protein
MQPKLWEEMLNHVLYLRWRYDFHFWDSPKVWLHRFWPIISFTTG